MIGEKNSFENVQQITSISRGLYFFSGLCYLLGFKMVFYVTK